EREGSGIVLDQNGDEPFDAAKNRPVDYHRTMLGVVGADVLEVEVSRLLVIELDRRALPLAADRVGDIEVDLWPVERPVALIERVRHAGAIERRFQLRFGVIPGGDLAEKLRRPRGQFRRERQPEIAVYALHQTDQPFDFRADL